MKPILEAQQITVAFLMHLRRAATLKRQLVEAIRGRGQGQAVRFEALKDVSFQAMPGEALGICGRNGSGKSTLLRVISGCLTPLAGTVTLRGRVGGVLSLGGGFHHDLSGRENIMMQCLLHGLSPKQIRGMFDSIVEFAGLGDFVDAPVRTYSAGMAARLGFATAAHMEADILLIDEILSVGDLEFQAKCRDWLEQRRNAGATMLLVSHEVETMRRMCGTVLWLDKGAVRRVGKSDEVMDEYVACLEGNAP